jgi:hypothetical protein
VEKVFKETASGARGIVLSYEMFSQGVVTAMCDVYAPRQAGVLDTRPPRHA